MSNQETVVSALERRIDMSVPLADIEKDVEARLKQMARTVKMPGFRPGKVPFRMVAQSYGQQARSEAIGAAVERVLSASRSVPLACASPATRASSRKMAPAPKRWSSPPCSRSTRKCRSPM
jgi:hypothetical protein